MLQQRRFSSVPKATFVERSDVIDVPREQYSKHRKKLKIRCSEALTD